MENGKYTIPTAKYFVSLNIKTILKTACAKPIMKMDN